MNTLKSYKNYFPSVIEYLKLTESYDKFINNSYAIGKDEIYIPCYYLSVLHIKNIGKQKVYDIEVKDTHNFVANGAVVHNCIKDTELLQQLVDHQKILISILQLANVTHVPVSYLITRGQTVKVFSQLLRKARQMGFLIPHTNFNENEFAIIVKSNNHGLVTPQNIIQYIDIDCGKQIQTNFSGELVNKPLRINGKLSEVLDENTFIILSDIEITKTYYNTRGKMQNKILPLKSISPYETLIDDTFTGATVMEATPGFYSNNIAVEDFASLYPTIIISRNLCYSTFVNDPQYDKIKDIKYERLEWDDTIEYKLKHTCEAIGKSGKSRGMICGKPAFFEIPTSTKIEYVCRIHDPLKKTRDGKLQKKDVSYDYTIVQPRTIIENGIELIKEKGVLPSMLEELYTERKNIKKDMKIAAKEENWLLYNILDHRQLGVKISLNSSYGFLGRKHGSLILKELGSIVTSIGRKLLEESKEYVETTFVDYIRENNLITHTLTDKGITSEWPRKQKLEFLDKFRSI